MALKLHTTYPGRFDSPSENYPQGKWRNRSNSTAHDGGYLEEQHMNDIYGFFGALLRNAEMSPNGEVDTAKKSQFYDALVAVAKKAVCEEGYRKLDDNVFNGLMTIKSDNDEQGAGISLRESDGTVRGQVVATDQGLQLTQYPKDGGLQTFTFPSEGGEVMVCSTQEKRNIVYMADLGAKPEIDCHDIYNQAINMLPSGGTIVFGAGKWISSKGFTLHPNIHVRGVGKGVTILTKPNNNDSDILKSINFDELQGSGPVKDAPKHIEVTHLTVDGNYLEDYKSASKHIDTTYNNTKGYGVKLIATKYRFNIELVNCAEVGWYSEVVDYTGYDDEHSSHLSLEGRVFGKEAIVYRGVPDCNIEHVIIGCAGWKATKSERDSEIVMSDLFDGEPVHVFVSDESGNYHGHHEFTFMHLYGNYNGYGYFCNNSGRIKGNHLVVENCRGGFKNAVRSWGGITLFEAHNNGRQPSKLVGEGLEEYYDFHNKANAGFFVNGVIRQVKTQQDRLLAVRDDGSSFRCDLSYLAVGDLKESNNAVVEAYGHGSSFNIVAYRAQGYIIDLGGSGNNIKVTSNSATYPVLNLQKSIVGNNVEILMDGGVCAVNNDFESTGSNYIKVRGQIDYNSEILTGNINTYLDVQVHRRGRVSAGVSAKDLSSSWLDFRTTQESTVIFKNHFYKNLSKGCIQVSVQPSSASWTITNISEDSISIDLEGGLTKIISVKVEDRKLMR